MMRRSERGSIAWRGREEARQEKEQLNPLQHLVETEIAAQTKVSRLMAMLLARKLKEQGVSGLENRLDELEAEIERQLLPGTPSGTFVFDDGSPELNSGLSLDFSTAELEEFSEHVTAATKKATADVIDLLYEETKKEVGDLAEESLQRRAKDIRDFQKRLALRWEKPLRSLSLQIGLSAQYGQQMNEWLRREADPTKSAIVDVLTRLHARATQVACEIEILLKGGFADGALSRWRTLHELTIVAFFITEHGNGVAQRYLDHLRVDSLRMARQLNAAASQLGHRPVGDQDFLTLQTDVVALKLKYGEAFGGEYGWAADVLSNQRPTFAELEKAVNLEKYRPYYKLASDNVHAGPKGVFHRLGLSLNQHDMLLAGPSNAGLEEAGRLTAISLGMIATSLLALEPIADGIVWGRIISELSFKIENEFLAESKRLAEDESNFTELRSPGPRRLKPSSRR